MLWLLSLVLLIFALGLLRDPDLFKQPLAAVSSWLNTTGTHFSQTKLTADWRQVINGLVTLFILALLSTADVAVLATTVEDLLGKNNDAVSTLPQIGSDTAFGATQGASKQPASSGGSFWDQISAISSRQPKVFIAFAFFGISLLCGYLLALALGLASERTSTVPVAAGQGTISPPSSKPYGVSGRSLRFFLIGAGVYAILLTAQVKAADRYKFIVEREQARAFYRTPKSIQDELRSSVPVETEEGLVRIAEQRLKQNPDSTLLWIVAAMSAGALVCGLLKTQAQEAVTLIATWLGNLVKAMLGFVMQLGSKFLDVLITLLTIPKEIWTIAAQWIKSGETTLQQRFLRRRIESMYRPGKSESWAKMSPHEQLDVLKAYEVLEDASTTESQKKVARMRIDIILARNIDDQAFHAGAIRMLGYLTDSEMSSMDLGEMATYAMGKQTLADFVPAKLSAPTAPAQTTIARRQFMETLKLFRPDAVSFVNLSDSTKVSDPEFNHVFARYEALVDLFQNSGLSEAQTDALISYGPPVPGLSTDIGGFERFYRVTDGQWVDRMSAYAEMTVSLRNLLKTASQAGIQLSFPRRFVGIGPDHNGSASPIRAAKRAFDTLASEISNQANLLHRLPIGRISMSGDWFANGTDANFNAWLARERLLWSARP